MSDHYLYSTARKKVKEKKEFYSNVASWLSVSFFLFILNFIVTPDFVWAFFPFIGWGIGVFFHGLSVYSHAFRKDWEEKQINREIKRLKRRHPQYHEEEYLDLDDLKELRPRYRDSDFV